MTEIIFLQVGIFFFAYMFLSLNERFNENFKFYHIFKISGALYFFLMLIADSVKYIIKYKTLLPSLKPTAYDFYTYFFSISFFIIGLLFEILEGQKKIRGDIRFKVGDVYIYTFDESKSFIIHRMKDVNIYICYLNGTTINENIETQYGNIETTTISKVLKMIDEGIITKNILKSNSKI
jgi:hypothetical protein